MTAAGIIAFLIGLVLAQKFRVLILLPPLFLIVGAGIIVFTAPGTDTRYIALTAGVGAVALQIGYALGAVLRHWKMSRSGKVEATAKAAKRKSDAGVLPVH